jgi:uncharacterized protein YkwD
VTFGTLPRIVATLALVAGLWWLSTVVGEERAAEPEARQYPTYGCADADVQPRDDLRAATRATLCLLNAERRRHRLPALRPDPALARAARRHSADMVRRDYFGHDAPGGTTPDDRIRAAGYRPGPGGATGENLAWGEGSEATPASMVDGWMHSPGHRRNILRRRFADIGIGIEPRPIGRDTQGATYTTTFGG